MDEDRNLAGKAAIASAIAGALPGVGITGSPVRVPKGFASESWRVTTDLGELLVKIRRRAADAAKLRNQAEALRLARSGGVPAPELLYAGASDALGGRPLIVLRYIPGVDAEEALPGMDDRRRDLLFSDLGEAVGRLHGIAPPKFTDRLGTPEADLDDWADAVGRRTERAALRNREIGLLSVSEIDDVVHRLTRTAEKVSGVVAPALTHHDLYLANVLLRDRRFAALLDFELARAWDPMFDFVKLGMWVFEELPKSFRPFVAAYRHRVGRITDAEERLALCLALENFVALGYWVDQREARLAEASRTIIRNWLSGSYPWWVKRLGADLR